MDIFITGLLGILGIVSYMLVVLQGAGFGLALFSWIVGIPVLSVYSFMTLSRVEIDHLWRWTNEAQMGFLPMVLIAAGLSLFACYERKPHAKR